MDKTKFHEENEKLTAKIEDLKRKKVEWQDKLKTKMSHLSMVQARLKSLEDENIQVRNRKSDD